ncbi:chaperone protein DnaJ [Comamonadaceae bacterium OS-1]|nr:chaperone protein DnaJ [Comamonadaceae bacterium OS-1]
MNAPDHYVSLGIRPNASIEEIELAFKARRSQYHPDRYNQSEASTVQWATKQMQLVNAAYQVLSNPSTRSAYEQERNQANHRPAQPQSASKPNPTTPVLGLRQYLAQNLSNFAGSGRIYLAPNVPLKKLSGALESYGGDLDAADVLVLIDDTVFGGGGDGILVTENALLVKSLGDDGYQFQMKSLTDLETSKNALYINGRKLIQLNMSDAKGVDALFLQVRNYAVQKYSIARQASTSAAGSQASGTIDPTASAELPTPEQLFAATKAQFGVLYRSIQSMDMDDPMVEQVFAALALRYFETTESSLSSGRLDEAAFSQLGKVYLLTCNLLEVMQGEAEVNTNLLRKEEGDGPLLNLLSSILKRFGPESQPTQVRSNADRYFGAD